MGVLIQILVGDGTWEQLRNGEVLIDDGYSENPDNGSSVIYASVGDRVGSQFHKLTTNEMPSHTHTFTGTASSHTHRVDGHRSIAEAQGFGLSQNNKGFEDRVVIDGNTGTYMLEVSSTSITPKGTISNTGNGIRFELTPKGLIVARWHRTA